MNDAGDPILADVVALARALPRDLLTPVLDALMPSTTDRTGRPDGPPPPIPPALSDAFERLLAVAQSGSPGASPEALSLALRAAWEADERRRAEQSIELVWTGPSPPGSTLRRTDQVLLEVIEEARRCLHVVTFAAYRIPRVWASLLAATRRGVDLTIVLESSGKVAFDPMVAIGADLMLAASVYAWPAEARPRDEAGHFGSLHVKCAVADDKHLLVSSANLTDFALELNMELGVSLRGGELPRRVADHLRYLIRAGILRPMSCNS